MVEDFGLLGYYTVYLVVELVPTFVMVGLSSARVGSLFFYGLTLS